MANKILDLRTLAQKDTFDVTLINGSVLNLNKPSERLLLQIITFEEYVKETADLAGVEKSAKVLEMQKEITREILAFNRNGVKIDDAFMSENDINYYTQKAIITSYSAYLEEIANDPNFKSPRAQMKKV